jgi:DNA polymerase III sliding clamp (beta) subunit (PCNA family)
MQIRFGKVAYASRLIKMRERARENYFKYLCRHQDIGKTEEKIKKGKNAEEEMEMRYCVELFIGFD